MTPHLDTERETTVHLKLMSGRILIDTMMMRTMPTRGTGSVVRPCAQRSART